MKKGLNEIKSFFFIYSLSDESDSFDKYCIIEKITHKSGKNQVFFKNSLKPFSFL